MARTENPDSAAADFFINLKDNKFFDKNDERLGYTVFGKVIEGMDVVDKIKAVKTETKKFTGLTAGDEKTFMNVPVEDVVIKSVRVEKPK
jgi:cyclophilin family peptidyl-prolyl cis-trans isomerase